MTTGPFDIRGQQPSQPGDTDEICGPLSPDTVGLVTSSTTACSSSPGFVWTLRSLGAGQVAFITSGDFSSGYTEPDWSNTTVPGNGDWVYNAGLRNFVHAACSVPPAQIPATRPPVTLLLSMMVVVVALAFQALKRRPRR